MGNADSSLPWCSRMACDVVKAFAELCAQRVDQRGGQGGAGFRVCSWVGLPLATDEHRLTHVNSFKNKYVTRCRSRTGILSVQVAKVLLLRRNARFTCHFHPFLDFAADAARVFFRRAADRVRAARDQKFAICGIAQRSDQREVEFFDDRAAAILPGREN